MTIFFTADTHFGHANVIKHCNRPFGSVAEMNAALVQNWNAVVCRDDDVWHLGDFAWGNTAAEYRRYLNGRIHLIHGNHDSNTTRRLACWESSQFGAEINVNGILVTLCHYAMKVWNKSHYGSLMLYGHSHGGLDGDRQSTDVGVDCWNYRPVTLVDILERIKGTRSHLPVDHHGAT